MSVIESVAQQCVFVCERERGREREHHQELSLASCLISRVFAENSYIICPLVFHIFVLPKLTKKKIIKTKHLFHIQQTVGVAFFILEI